MASKLAPLNPLNQSGSLPLGSLGQNSNLASLNKSNNQFHISTNDSNITFTDNDERMINSKQRIRPVRFALKYSPAQIVLHYEDLKYNNKLRQKRMSLEQIDNNSSSNMSVNQLQQSLLKNYRKYLSPSLISLNQLLRLLNNLISANRAKQNTVDLGGLYGNLTEDNYDEEDDLNRVSESELARKKDEMSLEFEKRRIKPTDENYVYDKRVEFDQKHAEPSDWD